MFDFQTATLSALSTSLCWNVKVLASLTSCIWNKSCSQSQRSSVSSCSLPPRDTYRPWHRFCKSTHTRSAVIAYFLTSFNSSGAPGVTRHGLLSYTWPGWVTPLALQPQICFFPSSSALSYMGSVSVSLIQLSDALNELFQRVLESPVVHCLTGSQFKSPFQNTI